MKKTITIHTVTLRELITNFSCCFGDIIADNEPEDNIHEVEAFAEGLSALGSKELSRIRGLFNDGYTMLLISSCIEELKFDALAIVDGDNYIGTLDISDLNY